MFPKRGSLLLPLLAGALVLSACDGTTSSPTPRLSIKLTDAPGDLDEAWVKIDQIYLQGNGEKVSLYQGDQYVNLLTLSGGNTVDLVKDAVVPAGNYSEMRFIVCDAWVRVDGKVYATPNATLPDGVTADGQLQAPSACQSGFKVKLPGGSVSVEDESKVLVVDFDVSQSFGHKAGGSGMWVMHPVLHATDIGFSGNIGGRVNVAEGVTLPSCGGGQVDVTSFVPLALLGTDTIASGQTQADSTYKIRFVAPDTYTLGYDSVVGFANGDTLTFTAAAAPASVTVESGKTATADYSVTAVTCKVKPAA